MNIHSRARLTPLGRADLVHAMRDPAWSRDQAGSLGVSLRTAYKWQARFRSEGRDGLRDRSSRPRCSPTQVALDREDVILQLRRLQMTAATIARKLRMARSTVSDVLKRNNAGKLKYLEVPEPENRYERKAPGDLIHLDIKKLGRIEGVGHRIHGDRQLQRHRRIGWEYVHVAVDDFSRLAYVEVLANQTGRTAAGFLRRALCFFRKHGIKVRRVLTDNGSAYLSKVFNELCEAFYVRHLRTRPYRPRTNGKAERFIQTLVRGWAYGRSYPSSRLRTAALPRWLRHYNEVRPHMGLNGATPISRVA
jgi:transposase InsO family protein